MNTDQTQTAQKCASDGIRIEWCRICGGDGGWDAERPGQSWLRCASCGGRGETEVACELVTLEDISNVD